MKSVHAADLRHSWTTWAGVSIGLVTVNMFLALWTMVSASGYAALESGLMTRDDSGAVSIGAMFNLMLCALVGLAVVGTSASLVVDARRGALARLALAGATPRQIVGVVMAQLVAVTIACSVLGTLIALAALKPTLIYLARDRGPDVPVPPVVIRPELVLGVIVLSVLVALVGGLRQANRASRIPPVEALREASGGIRSSMTPGRWVQTFLVACVVGAAFLSIRPLMADRNSETFSMFLQTAMVLLPVLGWLVSLLAPVLVAPLTRAWTALVPTSGATWRIARSTVVARGDRMSKCVVPMVMAISLLFGMVTMAEMLNATFLANMDERQLENIGIFAFLTFLGSPLAIALAGGVGTLIMMSKQRDAELALTGVVGATPAQRVWIAICEGVMITVTASLLGLLVVFVSGVYLTLAITAFGYRPVVVVPVVPLVGSVISVGVIALATTTLPTLGALRQPEPKVIARLVAE